MSAVDEARKIQAWVDEDPRGRAADGLRQLGELGSQDPEVLDIGEGLAMTVSAAGYLAGGNDG